MQCVPNSHISLTLTFCSDFLIHRIRYNQIQESPVIKISTAVIHSARFSAEPDRRRFTQHPARRSAKVVTAGRRERVSSHSSVKGQAGPL